MKNGETVFKIFYKEEEFLDEYGELVSSAVSLLNQEWRPNYEANNETRRTERYFLSSGEMTQLVFEMAIVHHNKNGFSSIEVLLKSSARIVNVRIERVDGIPSASIVTERKQSG